MATFKIGDRVTYVDQGSDSIPRIGTVVNTWTSDKSVSVQWDDAPKSAHPWYATDALMVIDMPGTPPINRHTFKIGDRVTGTFNDGRTGTVANVSTDGGVSVNWDDAQHAAPWYLADALIPLISTDRQRMELYRAEMNRLQSTLKGVAAQRDTLAGAMLASNSRAHHSRAVITILTDLVESGNAIDSHGFLS